MKLTVILDTSKLFLEGGSRKAIKMLETKQKKDQLGGTFLITRSDGILFGHSSRFAGDLADLRAMLVAAETHALTRRSVDDW